jgi:hypothetical protein
VRGSDGRLDGCMFIRNAPTGSKRRTAEVADSERIRAQRIGTQ